MFISKSIELAFAHKMWLSMITLSAAGKPPYYVCVEVRTIKELLVLQFNQQPLTLFPTLL